MMFLPLERYLRAAAACGVNSDDVPDAGSTLAPVEKYFRATAAFGVNS